MALFVLCYNILGDRMKNKLTILFYILSISSFALYLTLEYNPNIDLNYFIRLLLVLIASIFIIIGNKIDTNKNKQEKLPNTVVFIYYIILILNMVILSRHNSINSYNLIPFKTIISIFKNGTPYEIIINILGNIIVFMPLEYFLFELFEIKKPLINFTISFIIILLIEIFQYTFKIGVFDIDDLILCTGGMMIFYIVYNKIKNQSYD